MQLTTLIHIILYQPEIPPNTGNIIRLAANTGCQLHLIEPLGFEMDTKQLRRAGLDYHEFSTTRVWPDWNAFQQARIYQPVYAFTTKGQKHYHQANFADGCGLLFGPETRGLPDDILRSLPTGQKLRMPMQPDSRSLNLSNTVAIATYEALRQQEFQGLL